MNNILRTELKSYFNIINSRERQINKRLRYINEREFNLPEEITKKIHRVVYDLLKKRAFDFEKNRSDGGLIKYDHETGYLTYRKSHGKRFIAMDWNCEEVERRLLPKGFDDFCINVKKLIGGIKPLKETPNFKIEKNIIIEGFENKSINKVFLTGFIIKNTNKYFREYALHLSSENYSGYGGYPIYLHSDKFFNLINEVIGLAEFDMKRKQSGLERIRLRILKHIENIDGIFVLNAMVGD